MDQRCQPTDDLTRAEEDWLDAKKKTYGYVQRDDAKRRAFLAQVAGPQAPHWVYVDESGMDERDDYGFGYSPAGQRCYALKSGRRQGQVNMIACNTDTNRFKVKPSGKAQ